MASTTVLPGYSLLFLTIVLLCRGPAQGPVYWLIEWSSDCEKATKAMGNGK